MSIKIKTEKEIEIMKESCGLLARTMKELEKRVKPGITTEELNRVAETLVFKKGGKCSFKDYESFPACLCTSINQEIVHGVPSVQRQVNEGDILSLDLGILYKGFHSDMAVTLAVGKVNPDVLRLIQVTKKALRNGIEKIKPGNTIGDIGSAIQKYVESQGFNVVRELCGHGIGKELHEDPQVLNYGKEKTGIKIKEGMVLCLEPMVTMGDWHIKKSKNSYSFETKDGSLSAHFEHTVAVTKNGYLVLTE